MTRINALRNIETNSVAWGSKMSAVTFAAVLLVCSLTVGCSSDKPKTVSASSAISAPTPTAPIVTPASSDPTAAATKPAPKKVVRKKPTTVNYTDKASGLSFEYPRRYAIETGSAAADVLASSPVPMNFVQPGGVALATVELPETGYTNTDFSSAFFNVSVNKTLTAEQCSEFAVPQPKVSMPSSTEATQTPSTDSKPAEVATTTPVSDEKPTANQEATATGAAEVKPEVKADVKADATPASTEASSTQVASTQPATADVQVSPVKLTDLEVHATEAVAGEGARQSDSKYFHVYQNGACYEVGLNVTTVASDQGITKHVNRDQVFSRLEKIMGTVTINPIAAPEVTAEAPMAPAPTATPAQ